MIRRFKDTIGLAGHVAQVGPAIAVALVASAYHAIVDEPTGAA